MSRLSNVKETLKSSKWYLKLVYFLLFTIVVIAVLISMVPFGVKAGMAYWLDSRGVEGGIDEVSLSLIKGQLSLKNMRIYNNKEMSYGLDKFHISWQWKPLFNRELIIDQIIIEQLTTTNKLFEDGSKNIAGIFFPIESSDSISNDINAEDPEPWSIDINNVEVNSVKVCLKQFKDDISVINYCNKVDSLLWTGNANVTTASDINDNVYIKGDLKIKGVQVHNNELELDLLNIESFVLDNINISTLDAVEINSVNLENVIIFQRKPDTKNESAGIISFSDLTIGSLEISEFNSFHVKNIDLVDIGAYIQSTKTGFSGINQWIPEQADKQPSHKSDASNKEAAGSDLHYSLQKFTMRSQRQFTYDDTSAIEPFKVEINDIELVLENIDSSMPGNTSHMDLNMGIGKHGKFDINAEIVNLFDVPNTKKPGIKGAGTISGFDLRYLAPITRQTIGHNIKSGQLDTDISVNIVNGTIDSNLSLALHHFELDTLSKEEADKLNSEFGFPLNSSLSLLRDRDNTIRLDIPVKGDIDNPEFDPRDAIVKASSKAITTAVIHYYTPFGLVFAAEGLFDLATAMNFEPILFLAGEAEFVNKQQVDRLSKLLNERPGVRLTLCGLTNESDYKKLYPLPEQKVTSTVNQEAETQARIHSDKALLDLSKLASSRSSLVKEHLVKVHNIDAGRLIECSPEHIVDDISGVRVTL